MGGVARLIPMVDLTAASMFNRAAWYQLPLAIAATAAAVALLLLAAKFLYFSAALGMQDSNAARSKLNDTQMAKATRALGDVRKPNLNWENEADVCKSNTRGIILFSAIMLGGAGALVLLIQYLPSDSVLLLIGGAVLAANLVGAALCCRSLMKAADDLPKRF